MLCKDVMTKNVIWVGARDSARSAARKMRDADVGFLPVLEPESLRVLGVITDRDIVIRLVAADLPVTTRVSDVMTTDLVSCGPEEDVINAERLMGNHQKSRILCLDANQRLVGVISLADIAHSDDEPRVAETVRQVTAREAHGH
jgi:CBS domain-containing protein